MWVDCYPNQDPLQPQGGFKMKLWCQSCKEIFQMYENDWWKLEHSSFGIIVICSNRCLVNFAGEEE